MSELVTALFLSELATFCITDYSVPLLYGILPILALICVEVITSFIAVKSKTFKKLFYSYPSILINNGKISENEMIKNRISLEELFAQLRLKNFPDIRKVRYAILEVDGQISVIPFDIETPVSKRDDGIKPQEIGFSRVIVDDGKINERALKELNKDKDWLKNTLRKKKIGQIKNIFMMSCDENMNITVEYKK